MAFDRGETGLPTRGNFITRSLGRLLLRLYGWKVEGRLPNVKKCVAILAPHTSNWDFFFGICAAFVIRVRVGWIGKHTLFRPPFGPFMRWLGGTPIRRDASIGRVAQIVEMMNRHERYVLGLSPEGTRKPVERWKTGFYHVALSASVPIVLTYIDYGRKVVGIGPAFQPTGDAERDLAEIRAFYDDKQPRYAVGYVRSTG